MAKSLVIFFFLITVSFVNISGQNIKGKENTIQKLVLKINKDTSLKSLHLTTFEFLEQALDGSGYLTGYFKNDSIVRIIEWISYSFGTRKTDFYFNKDDLIFIAVQEAYDKYVDSLKEIKLGITKEAFTGRYYYKSKSLIKSETSGVSRCDDNDSMINNFTKTADNYRLLLKKRRALTNPPSSH